MIFSTIKHFNHLNLIFDSISDMVFLISVGDDESFRYVNANDAAIKGLSLPAKFTGHTIHEIMPKDSADIITTKYKESITSKEQVIYEAKIHVLNDGNKETRYVESRVTPIFDEQGVCKHIIAITHDITERKVKQKELDREKKRLELLFNHASDAIYTFSKKGSYITVNPGFTKLFGWREEELINDSSISIVPEGCKDDLIQIFEKLNKGETIDNHESQRVTKHGDTIHVLSSYTPIMEDGVMTSGIAMYKDITELIKMTEQLKLSEKQYRLIFDHVTDLIRVVDARGITVYASQSHKDILGVSPEFYLNKPFLTFVHSEDMSTLQSFFNTIIDSKKTETVQYRRLHKGGTTLWMESRGTPVLDIEGNVDKIILISRDIGESKQREETYKYQANHDELTNLANRRYFDEQLTNTMSKANRTQRTIALFTLDCDKFKQVNDRYGHDVGDYVIKTFSSRIKELLGDEDIVSRVGGDEFQIIYTEMLTKDDAFNLAKKIIKSIEEPITTQNHKLTLTTSIGISFYEGDQKDKDVLIKESDDALYQAKKKGRNRYETYAVDVDVKTSYWGKMRKFFKK